MKAFFSKVPKLAFTLLMVGFVSMILGLVYHFVMNPEIRFWSKVAEKTSVWTDEMRKKHGSVVFFVGGSTTAFGIDVAELEKKGNIPAVNLGMHAASGAIFIVGQGLNRLQPGDLLVVCLEPGGLRNEIDHSYLGMQLSLVLKEPETVNWFSHKPEAADWLTAVRPGSQHLFTMFGKIVLRMPLYRYSMNDYRDGGHLVTPIRVPMAADPEGAIVPQDIDMIGETGGGLSADGKVFLQEIRQIVEQKGARVVYVLPWYFERPSLVAKSRAQAANLLRDIEQIMPVIREDNLGIHPVAEDFSDTGQHMTEEGSRMRTLKLLPKLQEFMKE